MGALAPEKPAPARPALRLEAPGSPRDRCEDALAFDGRPGGLAVAPDGSAYVSLPAAGTILRLQGGPMRAAEAVLPGGRVLAPAGVATGPDGTLFVADAAGHRVWAVSATGELRTVAGSVYGCRDGPGDEARFRYPTDVAVGPDGTCYVADGGNHRIRTISPDGIVATLAGSIYDYGDGRGPDGRFRQPLALDVDAEGTCYVADTGNNAVRRVTPGGEVTTLAGLPPGGDGDGDGAAAGLRWPAGIAAGGDGVLWVADWGNRAVRKIEQTGTGARTSVTTLRLSGRRWPLAVALAPGGEVLVAAEEVDERGRPHGCLMRLGAGR